MLTSLSTPSFFPCDFDLSDPFFFFFVSTAICRYPDTSNQILFARYDTVKQTNCCQFNWLRFIKKAIPWRSQICVLLTRVDKIVHFVIASCFYCFRNCPKGANTRLIPGNNFVPFLKTVPLKLQCLCLFQAYYRQGVALQCLGKHAEALAAFSNGLAQDPKSTQLLAGLIEAAMKSPLRGKDVLETPSLLVME